jgi:N-acetylglucosaminyldiphosphoundecaprenol N-acetyl-beta-D-mannosaminyltransferase
MTVSVAPPASRELLGVPIDAMTMEEVLARVDEVIARRGRLKIGVVNAAKIVNMRRDQELRRDVLSSDLILADGMSVVWAGRLLGCPLPERVAGIDLMLGMLRRGNEQGYRVYCLGATDEVLNRAMARIAADYPKVKLVGQHDGYFPSEVEPVIAAEVAAARPDVLLVGMTSPKKEQFLARWGAQLGVPVCHGVGGAFDVLAGKVKRAPRLWQRLGLEWLYRVKQEPRRLWRRYLVTNALFVLLVLTEMVQQHLALLKAVCLPAQRGAAVREYEDR